MVSNVDCLFLCNFEDNTDKKDIPDYLKCLWTGDWISAINDPIFKAVVDGNDSFAVENCIQGKTSEECHTILTLGIACLNAFCEINWTGTNANFTAALKDICPKPIDISEELLSNGEEIISTILCPELLLVATRIFNGLSSYENQLVLCWWKMRCYYIYQKILDENSPRLFKILENLTMHLSNMEHKLNEQPKLKILLNLEISQVHLMYGRVQNVEQCLKKAKEISGLSLELRGALGKRTKYQQVAVAQLTLDTVLGNKEWRVPANITHASSSLLAPLKLDDDLRLESVQYEDNSEGGISELSSLEQLICLVTVQYIQRSQPKDSIANEELIPFINTILAQKFGPWSTMITTLLLKCKLESNNKRTVERAMMQNEEIVKSYCIIEPKVTSRLSYLWACGLPPVIDWRSQFADLLLSIGLVKAALDLYLELQLWEDVIVCYTILEWPQKAAEIIRQQIEIKPTAKLYCLLGDATDDVTLYETAWEFSNKKSSRAQRHWGNHLFSHKKYEECIPHYQKSCEINSLQEIVWLRLGFAALTVENWELSATAYRRYTYLEPHSFEAWNNLAKVYVKQGNKQRAHKALNEALKYNYDNWQVWENMVVVSLDTGHFDDVVRGYHRLLDIRNKHLDIEVLTLLVKALMQNCLDAEGNQVNRIIPKVLELFGRITSVHPNDADLWQIYADISPNSLLQGQRLLKSYKGIAQVENWSKDPSICEKILNLAENLALASLKSKEDTPEVEMAQVWQLVSSARLTIQGVIRAVSCQKWSQFDEKITLLEDLLKQVTTLLQKQ